MIHPTCLSASPWRRIVLACLFLFLVLSAAAGAQGPPEDDLWITTGKDFFDALGRTPGVLSGALPPQAAFALGDVVVTRVARRDVPALVRFGHERFRRCSGFIVHASREEAVAAMEGANALDTKILPSDFTISHQSTVNNLLPLVDKTNILNTISQLSTAYTNRYYQYTSGQQSALWIRDLWLGYANGRSDVTVETYDHGSYVQPSVIMTIAGNSLASEIVVLGGHLDSIRSGGMTTGTVAPGADDNASGIAALSEAIRVLMANGFVPDRTVKFMGYAAEEVGLLGSGDIAADHLAASADVVAVMQLDMTDYNGSVEDIVLMSDYTNADLSAFVGNLVDTYQPTLLRTTSACGYGCSDHASWHNRGYPTVMPFEARYGQHNTAIHSSNDTLATLGNQTDHALKFSKLALSFAVETGLAGCTPAPVADAGPDRNVQEGNSVEIGTPALAGHTYSWTPGGATTAQVTVSPTVTTVYTVTATTSCGSAQDTVTVNVTPAGQNGPQTAVYDAALGAPKCGVAGSSCDSLGLLDGRANLGPEPNQPNTLGSCTDGTSGTYHSDESNDKIVVSTLDGLDFTEGATVQVDATVYAWSTGSSDTLDLYYAADANNPTWVHVASMGPPGGGVRTLSAQYTLPSGGLQAVRANFRYQGSQSSCSTGSYDDTDDLVFAVKAGTPECTVDADCDDGLFCNGAETCNAGSCQAGSDPCAGQTCDEVADVCVPPGGGCTVDDDFEAGAPAWTNDPASTCTAGAYTTGNPTSPGGSYQISGSHSGTTSIFTAVNSSSGVDDVDGGNCILASPTWSVANASTLSVWYWHGQRDAGDDPSGDFFRLEVSLNGGASWTTLASNGDSRLNPSWQNVTTPIAAGSNVKLRVQCSDGPATGDLVECGIDDVSICE